MSIYLFQDYSIGIYEHKIDLLRNGYNYDSIEYRDIKSIRLFKGYIKNWIPLTLLGLTFVILSFSLIYNVYRNSMTGEFLNNLLTFWVRSKGAGLIAVLFCLIFGIYCIRIALMKKLNIVILTGKKNKQFEINQIWKMNQTKGLIDFLKQRVDKLDIHPNVNVA